MMVAVAWTLTSTFTLAFAQLLLKDCLGIVQISVTMCATLRTDSLQCSVPQGESPSSHLLPLTVLTRLLTVRSEIWKRKYA